MKKFFSSSKNMSIRDVMPVVWQNSRSSSMWDIQMHYSVRCINVPPDDDTITIDSVLVNPSDYVARPMPSNRINQINYPIEQYPKKKGSYHL